MRYAIWNQNYYPDYDYGLMRHRRAAVGEVFERPWVVEALDGGAEFYYATYEDAIDSIYETEGFDEY